MRQKKQLCFSLPPRLQVFSLKTCYTVMTSQFQRKIQSKGTQSKCLHLAFSNPCLHSFSLELGLSLEPWLFCLPQTTQVCAPGPPAGSRLDRDLCARGSPRAPGLPFPWRPQLRDPDARLCTQQGAKAPCAVSPVLCSEWMSPSLRRQVNLPTRRSDWCGRPAPDAAPRPPPGFSEEWH